MCDPLCRPESSPDYTALSMDTQTIHAPMGTRRDKQDDGQGVAHQMSGEQRSARRRRALRRHGLGLAARMAGPRLLSHGPARQARAGCWCGLIFKALFESSESQTS